MGLPGALSRGVSVDRHALFDEPPEEGSAPSVAPNDEQRPDIDGAAHPQGPPAPREPRGRPTSWWIRRRTPDDAATAPSGQRFGRTV